MRMPHHTSRLVLFGVASLLAACTPDDLAETEEEVVEDELGGTWDPSDGPDALPADQAGPPVVLTTTPYVIGGRITFTVTGANANERVYVLRSNTGVGAGGPCFAQIGGQCVDLLNPVSLSTNFLVGNNGSGSKSINLPNQPALEGTDVCFQVGIIRGPNGSQSVLSDAVCTEAGYDTDADGVFDLYDQCPGFDDYYDWDEDGIIDGCDNPADTPAVYTTVQPGAAWQTGTYQGRSVEWYLPPNPVGLIYIFHGTGGAADITRNTEVMIMLNEWVGRGYGFVSFSSDSRQPAQWNTSAGPNSNPDWERIRDWRADKIASGEIAANTEIHGWGFSNGGTMVAYLASAAVASNWPIGSFVVQASPGRSTFYGDPPNVPFMWIAARNDQSVLPADVEARANAHINAGRIGQYRLIPEQRLEPTRFDQSDSVNRNGAITMWKSIVDAGWFTLGGRRTFPTANIEQTIDTIGQTPGFSPPRPGKATLSTVLASHNTNGYYAVQIGNWFDQY